MSNVWPIYGCRVPRSDGSAGSLCLLKDLQVRLPQRHVQLRFLLDSGCGQSFFGLAAHGFVQIHAEVVVAEVVFRCSIPASLSVVEFDM